MIRRARASDGGVRSAAALVLVGALLSGPIAMLIVTRVAPQPTWVDVETFARHYHPIQALPYALGYLLLAGFVLFSAECHALAGRAKRARTAAALVFTGIYAALVFTNYTLQLGYVPRALPSRAPFLSELTMSNPASFAWFLEMFGYAAVGIATWMLSGLFGGSRRGLVIRVLLVANGVLSIAGAAFTATYDRWVFSRDGMLSFGVWNLLIVVCFLMIAITPGGGISRGETEPAADP